jgi:hypothetical protein
MSGTKVWGKFLGEIMATTSYDFTQTRDQIIKRALRIVGVLSDGDTPTTDQVNNAADALNGMVKRWMNDHIHLWKVRPTETVLTETTAAYPLSTDPKVTAIDAAYIDTSAVAVDTAPVTPTSTSSVVPQKAEFYQWMNTWATYVNTAINAAGLGSEGALAGVYYDAEMCMYRLVDYFQTTTPYYAYADDYNTVYAAYYLRDNAYAAQGYRAFGEGLAERYLRRQQNTEFLLNGNFTTDTTSWTATTAVLSSIAGGQLTNCLSVANSGANAGRATQAITTWTDTTYTLSYYFKKGTAANGKVVVGTTDGGADLYDSGSLSDAAWTAHTATITVPQAAAATDIIYVTCKVGSTTDTETALFDTMSLTTEQAKTDLEELVAHGSYMSSGEFTDHELSREAAYCLGNHIHLSRLRALTTAETNRMEYAYTQSLQMIDWWAISKTASYFRPFMGALTAKALITYFENIEEKQEIIDNLIILADHMWDTCWVEANQAFNYTDRIGVNPPDTWAAAEDGLPAVDLQMIIAPLYAWLWKETGQSKWRTRGDQMFVASIPVYIQDGGLWFWDSGAYLGAYDGTNPQCKQYNQQLYWQRYVEWAEAVPGESEPEQPPAIAPYPTHIRLKQISLSDYQDIEDKSSTGIPQVIAVDSGATGNLYLYPVPDAAYTLRYMGIEMLKDFDTSTDTPDFPVQWIDAITYGLADSLADEYLLPATERDRISSKARVYREEAKRADSATEDEVVVKGAY